MTLCAHCHDPVADNLAMKGLTSQVPPCDKVVAPKTADPLNAPMTIIDPSDRGFIENGEVTDVPDAVWINEESVTVKVNVRAAEPDAFVAVTTYSVAVFTVVGEPDNNPVDVLKDIPAGAAGEIE